MKHLELHILQSFPVACLNRDDLNSPKTAVFGGVQRSRVSSQSWKRAIREMAQSLDSKRFQGQRTRLIHEMLVAALIKRGATDEQAKVGASAISDYLAKNDGDTPENQKVKTMYFMSPLEADGMAAKWIETTDVKKTVKSLGAESWKDAADISIFGRMVANDHSLTVEAASMFSHALSVHKSDNEIDFFTAVDDRQSKDESGAGMAGTLEFNSSTYYRFAALNLDMLSDKDHLGSLTSEDRKSVVKTFMLSTIKAIPGARSNTMNGNTLPIYVLCVIRNEGHPIQLVNAFEKPLRSTEGYREKSIEALKAEYENLKKIWGITAQFEKAVPEASLDKMIEEAIAHVG